MSTESSPDRQHLRLLAEGVVIVVSILLAFGLQAWWEGRQEQVHLDTILEALEAGFTEHLTLIDDNIRAGEGDQDALHRFVRMDASQVATASDADRTRMLNALTRPLTSEFNNSFLISVVEDVVFQTTADLELRKAVALWRGQVDELSERAEQLAVSEREGELALGRHPEIQLHRTRAPGESRILDGEVLGRIREDPEVMAIVARKSWAKVIHHQQVRNLRRLAEEVLIRLGEEQD